MKCPFGGKSCYRNEAEAKEARKTLKYKEKWENIKIYRCPKCKKFHLTSTGY